VHPASDRLNTAGGQGTPIIIGVLTQMRDVTCLRTNRTKIARLASLDRLAFGLAPFMGISHAQPDGDGQRTDRQTDKQTKCRPYTNRNW